MLKSGKIGWGGKMFDRIEGLFGIESPEDVLKLLDEKLISQEIKQNQNELKLLQEKKKAATKEEPKEAAGSPRQNAGIEGMDSPESAGGQEQPGTVVDTQNSPLPQFSKTWFLDNFGFEADEIIDLLVKSKNEKMVSLIKPLIIEERKYLLKSFPSVSESLIEEIPFTDFDWSVLRKNTDLLEIPFRRFVKSWNDSQSDEERNEAYLTWSNRITKSERMSYVERKVLEKTHDILNEHGSMNCQSLQTYGVEGSTSEIAQLIKSHGFLYNIVPLGFGSKNMDKSIFYGIEQKDIFVKDAGALIGNLYENDGKIELTPRGSPRIILNLNSKVCKEYANALNAELNVRGIIAEGDGLVLEGEDTVLSAINKALPYISDEKKGDVVILKKAIQEDKDALWCLNFQYSKPRTQVKMLKSVNMSLDGFQEFKWGVIND
jgi:hypothetical protein